MMKYLKTFEHFDMGDTKLDKVIETQNTIIENEKTYKDIIVNDIRENKNLNLIGIALGVLSLILTIIFYIYK